MSISLVTENGRVIASVVRVASSRIDRARGLLGAPSLTGDEALLLEGVKQVHTFGMRFAIDVLFCDARGEILRIVRSMPPGRVTCWVRRSSFVVECRAGRARDLEVGTFVSRWGR